MVIVQSNHFTEIEERGLVFIVRLKTGRILEVTNSYEDAQEIADEFERSMVG